MTGIDLSLADMYSYTELEKALKDGAVSAGEIDRACIRVIEKKFEAGLFEKKELSEKALEDFYADKHSEKIAYDMAAESITLLKNNLLPLSDKQRIAVIGENANDIYHILGDYTSERRKEDGATILSALKKNFNNVVYAKGWSFNGNDDFSAAIRLAEESDVILLTLGGTSRRDFEASYLDNGAISESKQFMDCGEGPSIAALSLPKQQIALLSKLRKLGKPIVSIVIMGRAYVLTEVAENSDALLIAYYPGQEGGYAISDILAGKKNPSGKLPVSLPRTAGVLPIAYDRYNDPASYYDCGDPVLFPFGFGLSYSSFSYGNLSVSCNVNGLHIYFNVTNESDIDGKEVAEVYLTLRGDSIAHKKRRLVAFKKSLILAKASVAMEFSVPLAEIGFVAPVSPSVTVHIGNGRDDYLFESLDLSALFKK